jgi:predicted nucleic acid-binding protein
MSKAAPRVVFDCNIFAQALITQSVYHHPIDPKDSHYVDLAVASDATLIVSRDKHLLNLMIPSKPGAAEFKARLPRLLILQPETLLGLIREDDARAR